MKRSSRHGTVAVEFVFTLILLISTALSVGRIGMYLSDQQRFVQASFEAARFAALVSDSPSDGEVVTYAAAVLAELGLDPTGLDLEIDRYMDGEDPVVTVSLTLPVHSWFGATFLPAEHAQIFTLVQTGESP